MTRRFTVAGPVFLLAFAAFFAACKPSDPVIAKVGSLKIRQSEFQRKLGEVSAGYANYVATPDGRRQFLDILIREKMILAAADSSDVRRSGEYRAELEKLRQGEAQRLREGQDYLLTQLWLDDLRKKGVVSASEDEAREYAKKHPLEVEVRHILVATPAEAQALAKKARSGANFALLAKEHSLDGSTAADGGKMPPAIYGEIVPDLEEAVFRMRVGEIVGPIKSKFGYHVIKKDGERPFDFARNKDRIMRLIERQKLDRYLQSIQEKFPVEVVDDQFK